MASAQMCRARLARWALLVAVPPTPLGAPHIHHHFHGPSLGYIGIGLAAAASWAGVPGPGEPVLIAGGILAARGRLDLAEVLVVAWLGAMVGGVAGWALGRRAGQALMTAPGPLRRQRAAAMVRGERFFTRFGVLAVYFAPSWVAGSTGLPGRRFVPANAVSAVVWVALLGVGAYAVGQPIADVVADLGLVGLLVLGAAALAAIAHAALRRRRRA
jgi:membrane protein DedA with SNARE-associated domain